MRKMRNRSALLALTVLLAGVAVGGRADDNQYMIPAGDLAKLERQALLGDAKAAYRLLGNAALAGKPSANDDAALWLAIAVENGHPVAQYNLGAKLLGEADPRHQVRAEYWLSRAAKAGDASASQLLKRVRKGELKGRARKN